MARSALLRQHEAIAAAVSALLHPHAEVVLHDLRSGLIAGIWNAFSGRRVGDESLLDEEVGEERLGSVWGPYSKTGPGGERLKSVSAVLTHPESRARIGLLCINLDVSRLDDAMRLLRAFVTPQQEQPAALFARDWREQMQTALHAWLRSKGLSLSALGRDERIALVGALDSQGLFHTRKAADHAAQLLGISRTSLYNYLRAARTDQAPDTEVAS